MPVNTLTTLLLGDVYAQPGCRAVFIKLKSLIKDRRADFTVINGE
ncbi:MAG: YmdB family metallophosphoesterase, partial [Spirochaetales bacterium]